MNYPKDIVSIVRNKTFSVEANFVKRSIEDDSPLKIFDDSFSRYSIAVIENGKAATANIPIDCIEALREDTKIAYANSKAKPVSEEMPTSPAFTKRFFSGTLKGKTAVEVLLENGDKGKEILNGQYTWLKDNLDKYPNNKEMMDAIAEASKLDASALENIKPASTGSPTTLLEIGCRPLTRKTREDGKCFCYESRIDFNPANKYPVSVTVTNYYAPVTKDEKGMLNVQVAQKDKSSEVRNTFNMTTTEWLNAIRDMDEARFLFKQMYFAGAFKVSEEELIKNRTAAKG